VHPAKNIYKDFSSGNGGDAINFLMLTQNLTYTQSLTYIAKKFNIPIENSSDFVFVPRSKPVNPVLPTSYVAADDVLNSMGKYDLNPLFIYLVLKFGKITTSKKFKEYYTGIDHTNELTQSFVIFWQIDKEMRVRSGKYIKYLNNGHRDKNVNASWHHKKTKEYLPIYPDFNLVQCFFGEHLLNTDGTKPVAIVESEKTAIVASLYMPNYIWLACGSKHGLNHTKCAVLKNRNVTLFPDLGAYSEWKAKALEFGFSVSSHLEKLASDEDRKLGLDLADYLLR
jgi:hypothetical protein